MKNKKAELAIILSVIYLLLAGAILAFEVYDEEKPIGCAACMFRQYNETDENPINENNQISTNKTNKGVRFN
ncbi:hypothetical protein GF361_00675 [Candidatus Woesearchaeota archaeon]|nr:hypothetical protein [Candidatus Woesearchaeota archaeon]